MSTKNGNANDINNYSLAELLLINSLISRNITLNTINPLITTNSDIFLFPLYFPNAIPIISNWDVSEVQANGYRRSDSVSSVESSYLFPITKNNLFLDKEETNFLGNKRSKDRRPRKENQDNIRRKIKRAFFNCALIKKLNEKLKAIGSMQYLEKFPQNFICDINQKRNKNILDLTLREIFEKKELFVGKENDLSKYLHNLRVVQSEEIKENEEFKKILNKKYCELYEEYINSDDFKIDEINRLKENKNGDEYIEKYIYLARHLIEFFSQ